MGNITSLTPAEIISLQQGQPVTTSLKVAEVFGKQHKDVLRKIATLDYSKDFNERNFALVTYLDGKGEARPAYEMTKDGFIFVVMGFTGAKAAATKEAYINAFNWMSKQLAAQRPQPAVDLSYDELHDLAWCWRAADKMWLFAQSIENLCMWLNTVRRPTATLSFASIATPWARPRQCCSNTPKTCPPPSWRMTTGARYWPPCTISLAI